MDGASTMAGVCGRRESSGEVAEINRGSEFEFDRKHGYVPRQGTELVGLCT